MAITETSLYAHCPTCNCSLQVPAAQNWIDPHDSSPCLHLTHNNVIHSLRESPKPLNNQPTTYPLDLISPTNKRIKAGEILDYIRKIIKQQTLCKKHEQVLDRALVELQRSYQVPTDSVENSNLSCDELGGQTDQALIYSFIQLKKIAHCHHCRAPVKDRSNESVPYDGTSGSRTNHAGLIWALLRNWCDVFRSRRPHARRHRDVVRNENADAGPRNRLVGSEPFFSTVDCGTDRVDKSDYCWQWLLTQTEPVLLKDKTTRCSNHVENYSKLLENLTPNISYPTSHSCFSFSWSYRSDRLRYAKAAGIPLRTRSHSMSEISTHDFGSPVRNLQSTNHTSIKHHDQRSKVSKLPVQLSRCRRKCSPLSSPRSSEEGDDMLSQSPKPKAARCNHLPHHVTRRTEGFRTTYRTPVHRPSPVFSGRIETVNDGSRTFQNPIYPGAPLSGMRIADVPYCSAGYVYYNQYQYQNQTQQQYNQQSEHQQRQHRTQPHANLRTIHFLQSLSPNMNVVPPPNHNPFAIKPVVR